MKITNDNGLLLADGQVVGYLFDFSGQGIYSPMGPVDVTPEQMETHNRVLSQAEIEGLDKCQLGQYGTFYYTKKDNSVRTFVGELVSNDVTVKGKVITFRRKGRVYSGRLQKDADCFNFRRTY